MVGFQIAYAMAVRRSFEVRYRHSLATVHTTPRVAVMYAYGRPRHSEIWLPTQF